MDYNHPKLLYRIALTQINGVGDIIARNLLEMFGDEELIFTSNKKDLKATKNISSKLVDEIQNPDVLRKAEKELLFVEKNKIQTFFISDDNYPKRLAECADAPVLLYYKGKADLNTQKVIGMVGMRKSTDYGNDFCFRFLEDLSVVFPDVLIVSGLAYGIDIHSHRAALKNNMPTVGILAHGLDRIYPTVHRKTAIEMLEKGGLLTEFVSETEPDKYNFVRRNRIIAGLADAVIVVESDLKGGSLITADLANSYDRDVFAVPGRISDIHSAGCNKLISDNKAAIFDSLDTFFNQMNWVGNKETSAPKQKMIFPDLSAEEQMIYDILNAMGATHVNTLALQAEVAVSQLFFTLLELEMKGLIKTMPGGFYKSI